ncbi:MAG: DUF2141 domain-containing protein [Janthinobacterium lividum]
MGKFRIMLGTGLALSLALPAAAQEILGADAGACSPRSPVPGALVHVHGFKDRAGNLRIQLYSNVPADFLVSGRKLHRIEMPVTAADAMNVCVALPAPGSYALAVLHDRDGDHRLSIWHDGVGFSNNPRIGFGKPDLKEVLFESHGGTTLVDVVLNYRSGWSIRPLAGG